MNKKAVTRRREPKITYTRTLSLDAPDGGVRLSHLQELLREAHDRGLPPDAPIFIRSSAAFQGTWASIRIGDQA